MKSDKPLYEVGQLFEHKEYKGSVFEILSVSKNKNNNDGWVYFVENEFKQMKGQFFHQIMSERAIKQFLKKKK